MKTFNDIINLLSSSSTRIIEFIKNNYDSENNNKNEVVVDKIIVSENNGKVID
jgi:hypothetical protein